MSYKPRTLFRIVEDIDSGALFLPHIQRPFVWSMEQMRRLFDSLMCNYPIQTFLLWRTKDAIKARKFMRTVDWDATLSEFYDRSKSAEGVEKTFVLDGQQRLQTLYALFAGAIMTEDGKQSLDSYFDVTSGDERNDDGLQYRLEFSSEAMPLPWTRLPDLLGRYAQRNSEEIAEGINNDLDRSSPIDTAKARQALVRRNVSQLVSLLREERHFWVLELDGVASDYSYKRILEIFVRVNSGGTKLDPGDLMFAAMKEGWAEIEQNVEQIVDLLNASKDLAFDKALVLKCMLVSQGKGAELRAEKFTSRDGESLLKEIEENWGRVETAFQSLRDFIVHDLMLYGDKVIRSYNSFVPLFDYLYHNHAPTEGDRVLMRAYYYKSQLFNWYGARTDNVINAVHGYVGQSLPHGFPLKEVSSYFERTRDTELRPDHLENVSIRSIVLNLVYVESFGNSPFDVAFKGNAPHVDHIFPQSMLRHRLELTTPDINTIGNYRLVGATDNIRKRAELPDSYFARLKADGVDIARHLLVPEYSDDPSRLRFDVESYRAFRDKRFERVFELARRVVNP